MKFKTTKKQIVNGYGTRYLYKVGYCELQTLLRYNNPVAYTSGIYGWNFDLYDIDGVGICTGYRGMAGQRIDYELTKKYEDAAQKIAYGADDYETKKQKIEDLQKQFIKELLK